MKIRMTISLALMLPLLLSGQGFIDATGQMPASFTTGGTMDVESADLDGDGDADLILAGEALENLVFFNDGTGHFSMDPDRLVPEYSTADAYPGEDSEDIAVADFDQDGDLDLFFVSEDTPNHELLLNDGSGRFAFAPHAFPPTIGNAVAVLDINQDGAPDIIIGNKNRNTVLINNGAAGFEDETATRWPLNTDGTQDLKLLDLDADGDLDLIEGAESGGSNIYINEEGFFAEQNERLPDWPFAMETRKVSLLDADGDGDTDLYLANVGWSPLAAGTDRLLLNDGSGYFSDGTAGRLPATATNASTLEALPFDFEGDGDPDLLLTQFVEAGRAYHLLINDGSGHFAEAPAGSLPEANFTQGAGLHGNDFNGDGRLDLYFANYNQQDYLFLAVAPAGQTSAGRGSALQLFPNPASVLLNISCPVPCRLQIYQANGTLRWSGAVEGEARIKVAGWPPGWYTVQWWSRGSLAQTARFLKAG